MYETLISLRSFEERFDFLQQYALREVGRTTFGSMRFMNQQFYRGKHWNQTCNHIILRDNACDLAIEDRPIFDKKMIRVHHIIPLTPETLINNESSAYDHNNLICCDFKTHQLLTFGGEAPKKSSFEERKPYDHTPWRKMNEEI